MTFILIRAESTYILTMEVFSVFFLTNTPQAYYAL